MVTLSLTQNIVTELIIKSHMLKKKKVFLFYTALQVSVDINFLNAPGMQLKGSYT